jgi:Domain of unknown function (DUF4062)
MARPRVFISSTYYDLKHLRSSLENFVESLGFDAVLSEKGRIAYTPDVPLDESCYREVGGADIFVLIIGGRYGSEATTRKTVLPKSFYDRYNSVTRMEYRAAAERDVPMYVLVERSVYAEYETYLKNKGNDAIKYAHVDSVNIFQLVEEILALPRNNPVQQFEKYAEVEGWLREQWAGYFRELLQRAQAQAQLASLQSQVAQLSELNQTLKAYLEEIVTRIAPPAESASLIRSQTERLHEATFVSKLNENPLGRALQRYGIPVDQIRTAVLAADSAEVFVQSLIAATKNEDLIKLAPMWLDQMKERLERDFAELRLIANERPDVDKGRMRTKSRSKTVRKRTAN